MGYAKWYTVMKEQQREIVEKLQRALDYAIRVPSCSPDDALKIKHLSEALWFSEEVYASIYQREEIEEYNEELKNQGE